MPVLTVGKTEIPYEVRFSSRAARKRIVVTDEGVEVVAPAGTAWDGSDGVLAYVNGKRRWLFDSVREVEERHRKLLTQRFASGAKLQYRGRWLMLDVRPGRVSEVEIDCRSKFHVVVPQSLEGLERLEAIRTAFEGWLRGRALRDLGRFTRHHQANLGVQANGYRLSQARSRWGSCGRDGVVRVHWHLIQAPKAAMEYVVAHELAHLLIRNHSPAFWQKLAETMPDWAEAKELLERWERAHRAAMGGDTPEATPIRRRLA